MENQEKTNEENSNVLVLDVFKFMHPLQFRWKPLTNITTWELANAIPYIHGWAMIYEEPDMDKNENSFFRHFEITNPNKNQS